ncbi:hypothetical protein J6590_054030 [Homalodisca vitripennis]|nr:hypothetical protein J6590_054030 [Homalodisca vitripennis]
MLTPVCFEDPACNVVPQEQTSAKKSFPPAKANVDIVYLGLLILSNPAGIIMQTPLHVTGLTARPCADWFATNNQLITNKKRLLISVATFSDLDMKSTLLTMQNINTTSLNTNQQIVKCVTKI